MASRIEPDDLGSFGLLLFAGFSTLTRAEQELFSRVGAWPRTQLIFQDGPGMRETLDGLGIRHPAVPAHDGPAQTGGPRVQLFNSPDAHGQVFALNAALDEPDGRTVIVLPSPDTLFPLLRHCLSRFDESSYNVSLGYPLQRTPLYGFLNSLMELVTSMDGDRVYLPDYISFILHPYTKNVRFRTSAESTRVLFHLLEEKLAASRSRRFSTLEEIESDSDLFDEAAARIAREGDRAEVAAGLRAHLAQIHDRTIRGFLSFPTIRAFAEQVISLITWVHDASTARDHPTFTPISESFLKTLESIARSLMASKSFAGTAGYFALLRRYLQTCYHPFEGTPLHGMQVLGALETRNLAFDRVFVLDANEGVLPETGAAGTLLPFAVRKALKLSTAQDQEQDRRVPLRPAHGGRARAVPVLRGKRGQGALALRGAAAVGDAEEAGLPRAGPASCAPSSTGSHSRRNPPSPWKRQPRSRTGFACASTAPRGSTSTCGAPWLSSIEW